jgi:hypothetical protein
MAMIMLDRARGSGFPHRRRVIGTLLICLSTGAYFLPEAPGSPPDCPGATAIGFGQLPPVPRRKTQVLVGNLVSPSQEMKENVDFLLTPAILVQEAVSSGVVPTYPTE